MSNVVIVMMRADLHATLEDFYSEYLEMEDEDCAIHFEECVPVRECPPRPSWADKQGELLESTEKPPRLEEVLHAAVVTDVPMAREHLEHIIDGESNAMAAEENDLSKAVLPAARALLALLAPMKEEAK